MIAEVTGFFLLLKNLSNKFNTTMLPPAIDRQPIPLFQLIACQYLIINGGFMRWYT
ncbi:hypothetical protein QFZ77_006353 [Paenibacillus sp. V4I3]|nr:hypothetical protein [Paenibacillus sp. V4I3]MDQ0886431.1 hypothetical protein [Paenibacillus sp. V4I9]